jgi:hypothetical protein
MVTLNSWIYMVSGVLTLFQLQGARHAGEKTAILLGMVLLVTVGFGLLVRRQWARWVAVGMSLMTWLLGSVGLALLVVLALRALTRLHNPSFGAVFGALLGLGIFGVILWLNKRLYEYLTSEEGRLEFQAPAGETNLTSKSSAAYLAYIVVVVLLTTPGMKRTRVGDVDLAAIREAVARVEEARRAAKPPEGRTRAVQSLPAEADATPPVEAVPDQVEAPAFRAEAVVERANPPPQVSSVAEDRSMAQREFNLEKDRLLQRKMSDPSYTSEQLSADMERAMNRLRDRYQAGATASSSYQRPPQNASRPEDKSQARILRCRDSAGSILFTQNFCPEGSRPIE